MEKSTLAAYSLPPRPSRPGVAHAPACGHLFSTAVMLRRTGVPRKFPGTLPVTDIQPQSFGPVECWPLAINLRCTTPLHAGENPLASRGWAHPSVAQTPERPDPPTGPSPDGLLTPFVFFPATLRCLAEHRAVPRPQARPPAGLRRNLTPTADTTNALHRAQGQSSWA